MSWLVFWMEGLNYQIYSSPLQKSIDTATLPHQDAPFRGTALLQASSHPRKGYFLHNFFPIYVQSFNKCPPCLPDHRYWNDDVVACVMFHVLRWKCLMRGISILASLWSIFCFHLNQGWWGGGSRMWVMSPTTEFLEQSIWRILYLGLIASLSMEWSTSSSGWLSHSTHLQL